MRAQRAKRIVKLSIVALSLSGILPLFMNCSKTDFNAAAVDGIQDSASLGNPTPSSTTTTISATTTTLAGATTTSTTLGATTTSTTMSVTTTTVAAGSPIVSLLVQGSPNLPLNGTTTQVTVGFLKGTPVKVEISRDGYPAFATWPTDSFFTLSADGKSLTGNWCITSSCWGDVSGVHVLKVIATYSSGAAAAALVSLNVIAPVTTTTTTLPTSTTVPPPPIAGVEYTTMTAAMWAEVNSQRALFGDTNDCQARVNAIPSSGGVTLQPGADINAALASNSVVFLSGGTYKPSGRITVPTGKKLLGVPGQTVIIDGGWKVDYIILLNSNATLANVNVRNAFDTGVMFFNSAAGDGSATNALVYRVSSGANGLNAVGTDDGGGFLATQNAAYNCLVSTEAFDSYNDIGAPNDHGGNSDGYKLSFGAHHNTLIDAHSYRNSDDGIDMWHGGVAYVYFSVAHDNGKTTGKALNGNGNGIKLGPSANGVCGPGVTHHVYKFSAYSNATKGIDINGNTNPADLVQCTSTGNGDVDWLTWVPGPSDCP